MKDELLKLVDYKDCNFVTMPGHCFPKYHGIRIGAILTASKDDIVLFNGKKRFNFPILEEQLFKFLKAFPNAVFDGILGCHGDIETVKTLIKHKDELLRYNVIDTLLTTEKVIAHSRMLLYKHLQKYLSVRKKLGRLENIDMFDPLHVAIKAHFKRVVNEIFDEGYAGVIYRVSKNRGPFDGDKYDLIKIEERIC